MHGSCDNIIIIVIITVVSRRDVILHADPVPNRRILNQNDFRLINSVSAVIVVILFSKQRARRYR